jgi:sugar O-acyltransferase (sialic acid O-acetyltransferase NeuD family)
MKKDIVLIGGGGHCQACIDVVELQNIYTIKGVVDVKEKHGQAVLGYEVIGTDSDLPALSRTVKNYLITIGQIKTAVKRKRLFDELKRLNVKFPVIQSPNAYISKHADINEGTIVMHHALINAGVKIGCNCIINTKSLIDHNAAIGNHCHISTGAILNGEVSIGNECFIGSNSTIREAVIICPSTVVGAGAAIYRDILEQGIYSGNPLRRVDKK